MKDFLYQYDIYIISILIVGITLFSTYKNTKFRDITNKIFAFLGFILLVTLISELFGWIIDKTQISFGVEINIIVNSIIYAITPFNTLLLTIYFNSIIFTYTKYSKKWLIFLLPIIINLTITFTNIFSKYYFYVDKSNTYHRGQFFYVMILISYTYILFFLIYLLVNRSKIKRNDFVSFILLLLFPVTGSILQSSYYGIGITWPMFCITYLGIHLIIQQSIIAKDYLTGIRNRGSLDLELENLIFAAKNRNREFTGFMFDLDNFKNVNDLYGHDEGDNLLKEFSKILLKTFRRSECVGRLGGDEFMVLIDNSDLVNIDNIAMRLHQNIIDFNLHNGKPWKIDVSCGVLKYTANSLMNKQQYYSSIDKLLYIDKKKRKKYYTLGGCPGKPGHP